MAQQPQPGKAEPVDLPDDTDISVGANYAVADPCEPDKRLPGFYYFAAANDGDNSRPDGVAQCLLRGYEVCQEEKIASADCKLLRIPIAKRDAQQKRLRDARVAASRSESAGLPGVPEESLWRSDDHGKSRRVGNGKSRDNG